MKPKHMIAPNAAHQFEVFFDGDCPLCLKEINMLKRKDKEQKILFTDIAASDFDASPLGLSKKELMDKIHGRLSDGTMVTGVEVFRQLYGAVGFKKLVWFSRLPVISQGLGLAYTVFAKNRLRLTGRCEDKHCEIHS